MSSVSASYPNRAASAGPGMFLLLLIFVFGAIGAVGLAFSHGDVRHSDAADVRDCIGRGGTIQQWQNNNTGRWALVCQLGPTSFGVQIIEQIDGKWQEVTAFAKNKLRRIEQVERYLQNTGYQIIK